MSYKVKIVSSLQKIFPDKSPPPTNHRLSLLWNDSVSFQIAYFLDEYQGQELILEIESPLKEHIFIYQVMLSPSTYPCHPYHDDRYLKTMPGLFPDRLKYISKDKQPIKVVAKQWHSLWIKISIGEGIPKGDYPLIIKAIDINSGIKKFEINKTIEVIPVILKENPIFNTQWFHADCLADYYHVKVLSSEHFKIIREFVDLAVKRDINTILTPIFTPPLDTKVGGERTTVQLIKVYLNEGKYTFDYSLFNKWVEMLDDLGVKYFEMSHLFSQWGAYHPPKIMASVDGQYKKLFGWEDRATGDRYREFLDKFLPSFTKELQRLKIADRCIFHISDEPNKDNMDSYKAAREMVLPYLKDFLIVDALSDIEFYKKGLIDNPVSSNDHIEAFIKEKVEDLWVYYCTGQWKDVSNRFFSLPSSCNRILGVQLYKYKIKGFLHWGYNFYNSQYSVEHINPYLTTDAKNAFPSGDSFLVYPGADGKPEESIRLVVLEEAIHDLRALKTLEEYMSKEDIITMIDEDLSEPVTFASYPIQEYYLLNLRQKINNKIKAFESAKTKIL